MRDAVSRAAAHSFFLKILFFPRKVFHTLIRKNREGLLALGEGSITLFFLRHPTRMRLKDFGLLLLSFELSFSLSLFMQDTLTPLRRNFSFFMMLLSLLCIGPLDRLQRKRKHAVHLRPLFVFVVGALLFGFLGSLISPPFFRKMLFLIFGFALSVYRESVALVFALVLFPFVGTPYAATLFLFISLKRLFSRALAGKKLPPISLSFLLLFFLVGIGVMGAILWEEIHLPSLLLFLVYPAAFSLHTRFEKVLFLAAAIFLAVWCFLNPALIPETVILLLGSLLGMLGKHTGVQLNMV